MKIKAIDFSYVFMLAVGIFIFIQTLFINQGNLLAPASGTFIPFIISMLIIISSLFGAFKSMSEKQNLSNRDKVPEEKDNTGSKGQMTNVLIFIGGICIYIGVLPFLTFIPATVLFLIGTIFYLGKVSFALNLIVSATTTIVAFVLFAEVFNIPLP